MNTLFLVLLLSAPPAEAQPLTGDAVEGTLVELTPQAAALDTPKGRVSLELAKLSGIALKNPQKGPRPAGEPAVWVELVDGSTVPAASCTVKDGRASIAPLEGAAAVEVGRQDVKWIRLQPLAEAVAKSWERILGEEAPADLLVTRKDDVLDYHKGVVKSVGPEIVEFDLDGEVLPVKRAKVFAVIYHQAAGRELPEVLCAVHEASGAVWQAKSVALAGEQFEWTTLTGVKLARPADAVARLDFTQGKILFLSDLKPESVEWTPYFGLGKELPARAEFYAPRSDRSMSGGSLELDGKTYRKGVSIHSRTTLVYRLPSRFSRFTAAAGIDDRVRPRGHVRLVIRGDDKVLFDSPIAGSEPAKPLDLDVTGVRRLTVFVDFGSDLDIADHLDLCDARLVK